MSSRKFIPIISDEKSEKASSKNQQRPLDQGSTLNQAADSVEAVKAFEITIDSLTGDYRDGHFVSRNGPNMDVAMKIKEQIASNMRVFQVSLNGILSYIRELSQLTESIVQKSTISSFFSSRTIFIQCAMTWTPVSKTNSSRFEDESCG